MKVYIPHTSADIKRLVKTGLLISRIFLYQLVHFRANVLADFLPAHILTITIQAATGPPPSVGCQLPSAGVEDWNTTVGHQMTTGQRSGRLHWSQPQVGLQAVHADRLLAAA